MRYSVLTSVSVIPSSSLCSGGTEAWVMMDLQMQMYTWTTGMHDTRSIGSSTRQILLSYGNSTRLSYPPRLSARVNTCRNGYGTYDNAACTIYVRPKKSLILTYKEKLAILWWKQFVVNVYFIAWLKIIINPHVGAWRAMKWCGQGQKAYGAYLKIQLNKT